MREHAERDINMAFLSPSIRCGIVSKRIHVSFFTTCVILTF